MPRSTASPTDECATQAAQAILDFIENKLDCTLEKRRWMEDLEDTIGDKINGPIEEALDEAYDEGYSDAEE